MLTNPFVLLLIGALPLNLGQLGVVDAFSVPLWVVATEVAPATVCLLILAAG